MKQLPQDLSHYFLDTNKECVLKLPMLLTSAGS